MEFETPSWKLSPRVSVGVEGGLLLCHPRPKTRTSPVVTEEVNAAPQLLVLQFAANFDWTNAGVVPPPAETELEAARVKVFPRVSVGVEGGLCPDHPRPKARMFPETTFELKARPQLTALQFEVYLDWTSEGVPPLAAVIDFEAPSVKELPCVSVGVEGGF